MKYLRFISAFETTLKTAECDNRRKLLFLIQHYTGKVKSLIKSWVRYAKAKQNFIREL